MQSTFFVSDHCFVECNLSFPCLNSVAKELQYRKMKHLNLQAFKADITDSSLCIDPCSDLDGLAKSYDYTLSHILEKRAPIQKKFMLSGQEYHGLMKNLDALRLNGENWTKSC